MSKNINCLDLEHLKDLESPQETEPTDPEIFEGDTTEEPLDRVIPAIGHLASTGKCAQKGLKTLRGDREDNSEPSQVEMASEEELRQRREEAADDTRTSAGVTYSRR